MNGNMIAFNDNVALLNKATVGCTPIYNDTNTILTRSGNRHKPRKTGIAAVTLVLNNESVVRS